MTVKQKPLPAIVKKAAVLIKNPESATRKDIKEMASRILNDQDYAPQPHKPMRPGRIVKLAKKK